MPPVVFVHNTLNPPDNQSFLDLASSYGYDAPYVPMLSTLLPWAWDDFTSATTATIRAVSWQGGYCGLRGPGRPPSVGPPRAASTSAFQVWFYPDVNGRPQSFGPPLYGVTLTSAEAHEQFAFDSVRSEADCAYYDYTAVLPMPFPATAGTRYWLLIRADKGETGIFWGWRVGRLDNSISAHGALNGGIRTQPRDLAFSLHPAL